MLSINKKAIRSRAVTWRKLQNFKRVYNQLFLEKRKDFIYKTSHIKEKLGEKNTSLYKGQISDFVYK